MANPKTEPAVTSDEVQEKWQEVQEAVREQVEHKVLGMSYLTAGLIAVGVGALGTAYYLGRRGAEGPRREAAALVAPQSPRPSREGRTADKRVSNVLEPVIDQALRSAVTAVMDGLKHQLSPQ